MRITFYRPGDSADQPYLQLWRPTHAARQNQAAVLAGELSWVRPGFSDQGTLHVSHPVQFQHGDWVRVWRTPKPREAEPTVADYLGRIVSEPWHEGPGDIALTGLGTLLRTARWVGQAEGEFRPFFGAVLNQAVLPQGFTVPALPDITAKFKADTPHEFLGDVIDAITPALGGYMIGVDHLAQVRALLPTQQRTHRFVTGQAEMPPGNTQNYANAVRFSFEMPNGDEGIWEVMNEPEITLRRAQIWAEEQLTAREVGLPAEPVKASAVKVHRSFMLGGQSKRILTLTENTTLDKVKLGELPRNMALRADYAIGDQLRRTLPAYSEPTLADLLSGAATAEIIWNDPYGAYYGSDASRDIINAAVRDIQAGIRIRPKFEIDTIAERHEQAYRDKWGETDVPSLTYFRNYIWLELNVQLDADPGFPAEQALMAVWRDGGSNLWHHNCPDMVGEKEALETPTHGWDAVAGQPGVYRFRLRLPVERQELELAGSGQKIFTGPGTLAEFTLTYTPAYRRHLTAKRSPYFLKPIRLRGGGKVGMIVNHSAEPRLNPTEVGRWEHFAPLAPGEDQTEVLAQIDLFRTDILDHERQPDVWMPFAVLASNTLSADQITAEYDKRTLLLPTVMVDFPAAVPLEAGSAVLVGLPDGGAVSGVYVLSTFAAQDDSRRRLLSHAAGVDWITSTYTEAVTARIGRALPATDSPPEGTARFAVRGEGVLVQRMLFQGVNRQVDGVQVLTPQLDSVLTYGAALLRYRSEPVRDWAGYRDGLIWPTAGQPHPADGTAAFELPGGAADMELDVQRVTVTWGGTEPDVTKVQAGTPLPMTDEDAVAAAIQSIKQVQRRAGGGK